MIEIVNKFVYLGISFSTGGSFTETHKTLSGQALKAIFKLNQYLYKFTDISPKHTLELFYTGKCIRRFDGIYAYCRYFIDRKWSILVLILY